MNLLDRLTYDHAQPPLKPIPWPEGKAPAVPEHIPAQLPQADVLVVTWTAAEAHALADVLAPGHPVTGWQKDTTNWATFEPQLTSRSPARESKCSGVWTVTRIADKTVVLYKSDLHLSTDATTLPVKQLWQQLIGQVRPQLIITTGTAGGIGTETELGDVCVTNSAKFNCHQAFKDAPYAQTTYTGPAFTPGPHLRTVRPLFEANWQSLQPVAKRVPRLTVVLDQPGVETVDYFAFADATDSYGILANDPHAHTEEMDDATLPLALEEAAAHYNNGGKVNAQVPWLSIRNASDPQVPHMPTLAAEKDWAEKIYETYGYWTTICSAITCWAVIADM